ncbi:CBS domain-containing protein [Glaciecola sp. 1036]|uniref:CBS domain-containing protein n=1 Tax=Alteromonadaceae TaxID=72275 RepID=UPI003D010C78
MRTVAELMTQSLVTLKPHHTMKNAHDLISKKGIRHIPVMDDDNQKMLGLVTQKAMMSRVIKILTEHGADELLKQEMQTSVSEIWIEDFETVSTDQSLAEVANYFIKNKHGCVVVFNAEQKLVGILTSSDFVKLSAHLLSQ